MICIPYGRRRYLTFGGRLRTDLLSVNLRDAPGARVRRLFSRPGRMLLWVRYDAAAPAAHTDERKTP